MKKNKSGFIIVPRIITIAYIFFLMLFSFDVFGMEGGALEKMGGFLIHSVPFIALAVLLGVFWKHPFVLGWAFLGAAAIFTIWFNTYAEIGSLLLISTPPLISGILFLISAGRTKKAG